MASNADPFNGETQRKPIVQALRRKLWGSGEDERFEPFWESEPDRFVSLEALKEGSDNVTIVMPLDQWRVILGWFPKEG